MITIYYHCLGMTEADETFLKNSLQELAQRLKAEPIKLEINIRRLRDEPELTKKVDGKLNRLSDPSYMFHQCAGQIPCPFFEEGIYKEGVTPKLLVYCSPDSQVAMAALRQKPLAQWGATCFCLAAVYKLGNKFAIWHEAVHLLLFREDDLDECYEPYQPYERKTDCDCESCLMQHAPTEKTVGEWPSLCSKVISLLQKLVKKDLHFIGFLVNVDDSILKLRIGDDFSIEKKQQQEIMPFLQKLDFHYGAESGFEILNFSPNGRASGCYCINRHFPELVESTPQGGIVIPIAKLTKISRSLRDKLRLLRLFKGGNIFMRYSLFYHLTESIPQVAQVGREYPLIDRNLFHLNDDEYDQAEVFINDTNIPFQHSFLRLAFDSFEMSYDTYNRGLAFLSLMISMEALFSGGSEVRYRVSRNAAVLLGKNEDESQKIFEDMKKLYKKRSGIAHGGQDGKQKNSEDFLRLRNYVRESIKSICILDLGKTDLKIILNKSGFGQSPLSK